MAFKVLKIKFRTPNTKKFENETKGHLALRLNDTKVFKSEELFQLIEYVQTVFGVKYLTLISGTFGFEREIEIKEEKEEVDFFYNFEQIHTVPNSKISVNLVDNDSEYLFLLKLKENIMEENDYESVYKYTVESFTST